MKTYNKRIVSSIIFSCLAVITQSTAFATSQGAVENSSPANDLKDSKPLISGDVTTKDVEALLAGQGTAALGLQQYETDGPARIRALVSYGLQNRFQVQGRKIREVIGQGFLYSINSDESGNHVFITPVAAKGEMIDLTFICDNDKAIDLSLQVLEGRSQSILINEKELPVTENSSKEVACNHEQEIAAVHLLKMMIKDRKSRYDVEIFNKSVPNTLTREDTSSLSFVIDRRYGWAKNNLKGLRVVIKNHGLGSIRLSREIMNDLFEDVKSVHIAPAYLRGGESAFAYVIRDDGRFGQNGEKE
jgi:hypothetical protein